MTSLLHKINELNVRVDNIDISGIQINKQGQMGVYQET